jgi:CopG family transcriptional regulator, nickel-responsive regulator
MGGRHVPAWGVPRRMRARAGQKSTECPLRFLGGVTFLSQGRICAPPGGSVTVPGRLTRLRAMSDVLVRFGVAMEKSLLAELDELVETRGSTRSEALRDLARAAVARRKLDRGVAAVATLTLIYDHHVRDLSERLTQLQHDLGERIRSTLHVHLDHDHCLEVIILHGRSDELRELAERILAIKGVLHGGIEIYAQEAHRPHAHEHAPHLLPAGSKARKKAVGSTRAKSKRP